jgi:hypothetical protein
VGWNGRFEANNEWGDRFGFEENNEWDGKAVMNLKIIMSEMEMQV